MNYSYAQTLCYLEYFKKIVVFLQILRLYSIYYADCRLSLLSAQKGKCSVSGELFLNPDNIVCHMLLFESIERRKPDSVAVRQYKVFKLAAGKTAKSILVSTAVRLAPFNLPQIQALTDHDDMNLYTLGEKEVALYAVIPDNDNTFVRPDRAPCNAEKWYCPA